MKQEIYRIVDCFLTEAKDQNGEDRSLERLNADRHLAVEEFTKLFAQLLEELREEDKEIDSNSSFIDARRGYNQRNQEINDKINKILNK